MKENAENKRTAAQVECSIENDSGAKWCSGKPPMTLGLWADGFLA